MKSRTLPKTICALVAVLFLAAPMLQAQIPAPWMAVDMSDSLISSSGYVDGVFTITCNGDIWDPDGGHFVYQPAEFDNFEIVAYLASQDSISEWTKSGLMVRSALHDTAKSVYLWAAPGRGIFMQTRPEVGAATQWKGGNAGANPAPVWLKLVKEGNTFHGFSSEDGTTWTAVKSPEVVFDGDMFVGMAVASTSGNETTATAVFSDVAVNETFPIPEPWMAVDMSDSLISSSAYDDGVFTITCNGDIWDPDGGHFVYQPAEFENFEIVAYLASQDSISEWTKSGLMVRSALHDTAKSVYLWAAPGRGIFMQTRPEVGAATQWKGGNAGANPAPVWLKLVKEGNVFHGFSSEDGTTWTAVKSPEVVFDGDMFVGMAVASTSGDETTATAVFSDVAVNETFPLPEPWMAVDMSDSLISSSGYVDGVFTITSNGDIWDPDGGHFVYQPAEFDNFEIVAYLASQDSISEWTKSGLMVRSALHDTAKSVYLWAAPGRGIFMQTRPEVGAATQWIGGNAGANPAPVWLKLVKEGNVFHGFSSEDGATWTAVRSPEVVFDGDMFVGMAVASTSGDETTATAVFSDVAVNEYVSLAPWMATDLGTPQLPSSASLTETDGVSITAAGNFWASPDVGHFVYQTYTGDFELTANLVEMDSLNEWSKAGLMVRNDISDSSRNALLFSSPGKGTFMQARSGEGGDGEWKGGPGGEPLGWLRLVREGSQITGYKSVDGMDWGDPVSTFAVEFADEVVVGMAVASTVDTATVTAVFEDITLGPVTGVEEDVLSGIPTEFSLSNNYPNPFNPSTQIEFALPKNEHVRLVVFNVLGREVATLINGPMDAGFHKVTFDASHLSSGVYLYRFEAGKTLLTKKMTLFK